MGPYETETDALNGPVYREARALHEADPGDGIGSRVAAAQLRHLEAACEAAGVELGAYDRRILTWLAGYEASTVQVLVGLIHRAAGTGE